MAGHPAHLAVVARGEPFIEVLPMLVEVDTSEPKCLEPKFDSPFSNRLQQLSSISWRETVSSNGVLSHSSIVTEGGRAAVHFLYGDHFYSPTRNTSR